RSLLDALVEAAGRGGVGGKRLESVGAELVGAHLEGVLALDLEQLRDLAQRLGHFARGHGWRVSSPCCGLPDRPAGPSFPACQASRRAQAVRRRKQAISSRAMS